REPSRGLHRRPTPIFCEGLTCVRVDGYGNPEGTRKLTGGNPLEGLHRRPTPIF
ncbi:unnamed protein product, partial [Musa acuminata subsp. burmannicoides]